MKTCAIFVVSLVASASAFAPSTGYVTKQQISSLRMAEADAITDAQDTNFEGLDLARLLGAKRLSNIKRKLKREKKNDKKEN